jgi:hypothetical protein
VMKRLTGGKSGKLNVPGMPRLPGLGT